MRNEFYNKIFWGFVLIAVGVVFLLNQMDLFTMDIGNVFSDYWPLILVFFGLKGLFSPHRESSGSSLFGSLFLVLLGLMFLAKNLAWLELSYGDMFKYIFPALLILFGVSMIFKPFRRHRFDDHAAEQQASDWKPEEDHWRPGGDDKWSSPSAELDQDPVLQPDLQDKAYWKQRKDGWKQQKDEWKKHKHDWKHDHGWDYKHGRKGVQNKSGFLGDVYLGHEYWHLEPMNISHFIGDTTLDLTKATIPEGETRLNISSFIGDVKLFLPNDIDVEIKVVASSFIGDYRVLDQQEGGLMKSINMESANYADAEKKIRINASMFIGDVIVRRVG